MDRRIFVVVQARASHVFIVHRKAEGLDQMQFAASIGSEADDITGVRGDFRLYKDNIKHAPIVPCHG